MSPSAPASPSPVIPPAVKRPQGPAPQAPAAPALAGIDPMKLLQQYYPWLILATVLGVGLGYGSWHALKTFLPRWDAEVTFEVLPEAVDAGTPIGVGLGGQQEELETHMNTLVRIMESDSILQRTIQERSVRDTTWAKQFMDAAGNIREKEALRKMRKIVNARAIADTKIIVMSVGTPRKDDAPNIANALSTVFMDDVTSRSGRDMRAQIQQFEKIISKLSKDLVELEDRQETLLGKEKLTSLRQESSVSYNEVQNLQPALVKMREDFRFVSEQLERYEDMLSNPGGPVFPENVRESVQQEPLILQHDQTITQVKATIRAQKGEFGGNHPEVKRLERRLQAQEEERTQLLDKLMSEKFSSIVESLRNQKGNMEATLREAEERLRVADQRLQETTLALKQHDDMALEYQKKTEQMTEFERSVENLRMLEERTKRVRVLQDAQIPDELGFPKLIPTTLVGVVLTVGLVGGFIALKEIREQRVRGPQDVALIPRTRVLGMVPELGMDPSSPERVELAARDRAHGVICESVRQIRSTLMKESIAKGHKTFLIVSGLPGSGSSSLISNIAANAGASDLRVLVIDANLRRPSMHGIFGLSETPGLADILLGTASPRDAVKETSVPNVWLLPCGRRDKPVQERYASPAMAGVFATLKGDYDLILIDSTPAVVAGDAMALAGHADATVLVVRAYSEKRGLVSRLRNQFGDAHAEFLGVVVNAVKPSAGGYFKRNFQVTHEYGREAAIADPKIGKDKSKAKQADSAAESAAGDNKPDATA